MEDELLVQIDRDDHEIGTIPRSYANSHTDVFHRHVNILLFDENHNALVGKRSMSKELNPGNWMVVGGHVSAGQTALQAANAELEEEVGYATKLVYATKELFMKENESQYTYLFIGKLKSSDVKNLKVDENEFSEIKMINQEQLHALKGSGSTTTGYLDRFWSGEFDELIKQLN